MLRCSNKRFALSGLINIETRKVWLASNLFFIFRSPQDLLNMKYRFLLLITLLFIAFLFVESTSASRIGTEGISFELAEVPTSTTFRMFVYALGFRRSNRTKTEPSSCKSLVSSFTANNSGFHKRFTFRF